LNQLHFGDCRSILRTMAATGVKVQMCVTSPPYFGLRDYGTGTWTGGDAACKHTVGNQVAQARAPGAIIAGVRPGADASTCRRCGAKRVDQQLGLEPTPEQYIAAMVEVFGCVRDVLADDGTLWVNIGDSYANDCKWGGSSGGKHIKALHGDTSVGRGKRSTGLKQKDLVGIPWMLAFALRADGWYLRQDIIWHKPNPMPESVKDRCTKAHEYLFLLTKSPHYYFDHEAIKDPAVCAASGRPSKARGSFAGKSEATPGRNAFRAVTPTRNRRSVWTIATRPYKGAHFAVFPPKLIEPCILAGSRPGDIVLDPFMGSGTTAAVAVEHGRQYLGCELNDAFRPLQEQRISAARGVQRDLFQEMA
jgi:DNA modification methylase